MRMEIQNIVKLFVEGHIMLILFYDYVLCHARVIFSNILLMLVVIFAFSIVLSLILPKI
jgi:hypothetical protein